MLQHLNKENAVLHAPQHGKTDGLNAKTPFKIPLNDENIASTVHPKTGKKSIFAGRDPSFFVTPVGPRRQALAGKTTNVKAKNHGPSGGQRAGKKLDGTLKHQLITEQAGPAVIGGNNEVPEIEYMAPVPPEAPFVPEDYEAPDYSSLKKNYMRGCYRAYLAGIDENGKSELQRSVEASQRMLEEDLDAETEELEAQLNRGTRKLRQKSTESTIKGTTARTGSITVNKTRRSESTARKLAEIKRPGTSRPGSSASNSRQATSRSSSRPASSASISRPTASSHQRTASTADSRKAAQMLSQRPSSSLSNSRADIRLNRHARTASASSSATAKKPFPFSSKPTAAPSSRSRSRPRSVASNIDNPALKTTIGYHHGREVRDTVKKSVKLESTLDAIERIQREDEEAEANLTLPPILLIPEVEEEDDVVVEFPSPLIEEEEFFIAML